MLTNTHKSMWFMAVPCATVTCVAKYFCVCSFEYDFCRFALLVHENVKRDTNIHLSHSFAPHPHTAHGHGLQNITIIIRFCNARWSLSYDRNVNQFLFGLFPGVRLRFAATVISFMNFGQTWTLSSRTIILFWMRGEGIWRHCYDCFAPLITAKWWKGQTNVCRKIVNFYLISLFVWWQHVLPALTKNGKFHVYCVPKPITNTAHTPTRARAAHVPFVNNPRWILKTFLELDRDAVRNVLTEKTPLW